MASADNKSNFNADQNIAHECVHESVESIVSDKASIGEKNSSDSSNTDPCESEQSEITVVYNEQKDLECQHSEEDIRNKILRDLETLKNKLDTCTDIPSILYDVTLNCLKPSTIDYFSYHLDPEGDVLTPDGKCKDYRGLAEWIGLEPVFIKYVTRSSHLLKTKEVLSKWLTLEEEPCPNLKNLRQCLLDIERPDVLEDMSIKIALDAVSWKKTEYEAQTERVSTATDTSWQLTRHDVVTGKKSYYTCCLVYADEDEGMAQILIDLYKSVYSGASFFLPQYDLKQGKFTYDTTAAVIEERCGGKVIFIISEYFFASNVCRFTVNFCKEMESSTEQGNLIPFHLTNKYEHVPRVLRGIAGIRWYRKASRKQLWLMLTDSLLGGKMKEGELGEVRKSIEALIDKYQEKYIPDPPYDEDTPQPGVPISVYDPPPEVENSDDPSARHFNPDEDECLMSASVSSLEALGYVRRKSRTTRILHFVRKKIIRRVFSSGRQRRPGPPPSPTRKPPIMLSVVSGKKTMYTACLLYADEDELMAQLIIKLYKTAYKHALFFLPQFDLKHGKYILDTTAKVIDERCDKKVVFLLSEYFYASQICQFAVNYAAAHGTGHGNLIPFHLTRNVTTVPNVLKGIAGIRWFRKGSRQHTWNILTDSLLGDKITNKAEFANVKDTITEMVDKDKDYYLQDPPYDVDVAPPGEPIQVDEPEEVSSMPLSLEFEPKKIKPEEEMQTKQEKNSKWKFLTQIKKVIFEKVLRQQSKLKSSLPFNSSQETPMQTFKFTERLVSSSETNYQTSLPSKGNEESDDGMFGAVGGSKTCFNDLNVSSNSQGKDKKTFKPNIPQLESADGKSVTEICNPVCTQKIKNKQFEHDSSIKHSSYYHTKDSPSLLLRQEKVYCSPTSETDPSHTTGTISNKDGDQDLELETQALLNEESGEGSNLTNNNRRS